MTVLDGVYYHDEARIKRRFKKSIKNVCSTKTLKRKLPIIQWIPTYSFSILIQDIIAGITVGLTAIPQGIAYAIIAGLSPEYGLYAGIMGGLVYVFFGSCKDVTVGPTAIMAAMVGKYVRGYSAEFAVLAALLAGIVELLMGIFNFGFLVEFISAPVISGFTTAAALQIASSQLKSLFGLDGSSGTFFAESAVSFVKNIKTATLWDPILGFGTILVLVILERVGQGCSLSGATSQKIRWYISLSRNAVVVIIGMLVAFIIKQILDEEPVILIGDISGGLPVPKLPPFSAVVGNETYNLFDMLSSFGPQSLVIPLVAILEAVAIAKAFAGGLQVDANQEMIALGLCNIASSFVSSMPTTGSFTKTALNHASGVQTPAGGIFNSLLIILSLTTLTSTFYYIPKASLAGLIITAMLSMIDYNMFGRLWTHSKRELCVLIATVIICLGIGLEYGIMTGVIFDAAIILYGRARPTLDFYTVKSLKADLIVVPLNYNFSYCAAEHVRNILLKAALNASKDCFIIIDGTNLLNIDTTVASHLMSVSHNIDKRACPVLFLNFDEPLKKMCIAIKPVFAEKFITTVKISDVVDVYMKNI
ncbi:sodium-independent sulfate anion transporter-like [Pieris brassicae]|uniref:sodium-independent sulfate anion transporter-like n=1 Tax=Pieris brassicae TaxID=7116 RepID=UPI001E660660|nr:sodium-independent sulfate anion transporter-like [Pieris brassicae]